MRIRLPIMTALLVGVVAMWSFAQQPQSPAPGTMTMYEQMMAQMKANDAKLDALVTQMNAASGAAKVDAIAALVTEMVQQRKAMREQMGCMYDAGCMHGRMMGPGIMGGRGMMRGQ